MPWTGSRVGSPPDIVEEAIAAHGGADLWESAGEVRLQISSGGLAFASKLQGHAVRDVEARISVGGQHVVLTPYPGPGRRGVLDQDGTVRVETDELEVVEARPNARSAFGDLRHKLWWDRLDILYFATYAIWTYVSTPFVFTREGYRVIELDPWVENGEPWRRLAVTFPEHVHTHSRRAGVLSGREWPDPSPRLHRRAYRRLGQGGSLLLGPSVI